MNAATPAEPAPTDVPHGRTEAQRYLGAFIEQVKASGFVGRDFAHGRHTGILYCPFIAHTGPSHTAS